MSVAKVSLSLDEDALAEAKGRVGSRELSAYVSKALIRQLQHDRIGELLSQMNDEAGKLPEEMLSEARDTWRSTNA